MFVLRLPEGKEEQAVLDIIATAMKIRLDISDYKIPTLSTTI